MMLLLNVSVLKEVDSFFVFFDWA